MHVFHFVAEKGGQKVEGRVKALEMRQARARLEGEYDRILSLEAALSPEMPRGRVSTQALALSVRQFATMLRAGLPIHNCLGALSKGDDPRLSQVYLSVYEGVLGGIPLSASLSRHAHVFSPYFLTLVRAGELSGTLDKVLEKLAVSLERQAILKQKLVSSLTYPALSLALAFGVVLLLIYGVIPVMRPLFDSLGLELPWMTRLVLFLHGLATDWRVLVALVLLAGGAVAVHRIALAGNLEWQGLWRRGLAGVPLLGRLFHKAAVANLLYALATMLESGVMVMQAIQVLESLDTHSDLNAALVLARLKVIQGAGVSEALEASGAFPSLVTGMLRVGEESGRLDDMIRRTATIYEFDVETAQSQLVALTEPLILIVLGGVTGFIVMAAILPILELLSSF